jgi:hypothetical protein
MSTPTETPVSDAPPEASPSRVAMIGDKLLQCLADFLDADLQLAALAILAELDAEQVPVEELVTMLLTQTDEEDGTLILSEGEEVWEKGLDLLETCTLNHAALDTIAHALCDAFVNDTDTEMVLDLIAKLSGLDQIQPFIDLLSDDDPVIRDAGLEACYRLSLSEPILPLLNDPDPDTRALALENAWLLDAISRDQLTAYATDQQQPSKVQVKAQYWLDRDTANTSSRSTD